MKVIRSLFLVAVGAVSVGSGLAADKSSQPIGDQGFVELVDFQNDLIPVFTKIGCNAGACHGASVGRGGFNLSLYGGNPKGDHETIVHELAGRRINLANPEESLIILKPTAAIKHGGKFLMDDDDEGTQLLLKWIQQGAGYVSNRRLERVEISPTRHFAEILNSDIPIRAVAHYSDRTVRDVTRWTVFTAEDLSSVKINSDSGTAEVLRRGRHIVAARYLDRVIPIQLIVPLRDSKVDLAAQPRNGFIDDAIIKTLTDLRLPLSPQVDDASFARRVTLDLTGRLPKVDRVKSFLVNKDAMKRVKLVDELLRSEEFVEFWSLKLAKLLRIHSKSGKNNVTVTKKGASAFHEWLSSQLLEEVGYDQMARNIIMASGDTKEVGPANFYIVVEDTGLQTEFMTELFMGSRMKCANCHNHPLDKWTQDDYHGLTAIFARVTRQQLIKYNPLGKAIHPVTGQPARMRIPGEYFLPEGIKDGREALANWLTDRDNPYFAKAIVNRLWKYMMGRGLVEPVDDFRSTNPATHPSLLLQLADDFVQHDYDLRHTLKRIATSNAYSRDAVHMPGNEVDDRYYSHALQKPLEPEVLADAMSDVLGVADIYSDQPEGTRAVALYDASIKSDALDILGRCDRQASCESAKSPVGPLSQKLHLFNGELINGRLGVFGSRLDRLISTGNSPLKIVSEFYLAALGRLPRPEETEFWSKLVDPNTPANEQRELLEDFVWGLVTCREFVSN